MRAVLWPTLHLATGERLFDELDVWTEGAQARTTLRANIQHVALQKAFVMLEEERIRRLALTLSFGTVERSIDAISTVIESHLLLCHRLVVLVRGDFSRIRSPYRVQGFLDWLRGQHAKVGYRLDACIDKEAEAVDFVQPSFFKLMAPTSTEIADWENTLAQAISLGIDVEHVVVGGLEADAQKQLAIDAGFRVGQGTAVAPWQSPPALKRATPAWPDLRRPGALR